MHRHTRPCRLVGKPLLILSIHLGEVGHVGDENANFDDLVHGATGGFEDGLEVLAALGRLGGDGAVDEVAGGVGGDLARAPDLAGSLDGLAVGAGGRTSILAKYFGKLAGGRRHDFRYVAVAGEVEVEVLGEIIQCSPPRFGGLVRFGGGDEGLLEY